MARTVFALTVIINIRGGAAGTGPSTSLGNNAYLEWDLDHEMTLSDASAFRRWLCGSCNSIYRRYMRR